MFNITIALQIMFVILINCCSSLLYLKFYVQMFVKEEIK